MCNLYYADFWIMPIIGSKTGLWRGAIAALDPQSRIRVEHHFNGCRTFEEACDRGTKRCAQRARTTRNRVPAPSLGNGAGKTMALAHEDYHLAAQILYLNASRLSSELQSRCDPPVV
jgi:hypothetical protein